MFSVMNHLTQWLMRPRLGDDKPPSFWPSSAAAIGKDGSIHGGCRRKIFLQYLKYVYQYSKKSDGRYNFWNHLIDELEKSLIKDSKYMHWIWEQGNLFEKHIIDLIKESGLFVGEQIQVYIPEYNVSGKIDSIAFNAETGKYIITEIKSIYGANGEKVLGSLWERKNGIAGEPRDYNLMQIAIYQWHYATEDFDYGQLIYGDRGHGKYTVFQVDVDKKSGEIRYRCIDPGETNWVTVPYTIFDILNNYKFLQECVDSGKIPARDFQLKYSDQKLTLLINESYKIIELDKEEQPIKEYSTIEEFLINPNNIKGRKFLIESKGNTTINKVTAEQYIKYIDRVINGGRPVKKPEDGDYQCKTFCSYREFCYNKDGSPKH